ncbi:MAG: putative rane protein [Labilithrix sp.]|nr:putative rane protein [Labilithrix sp.]
MGQSMGGSSIPDPPNVRASNVRIVEPVPFAPSPRERVRAFMQKHGRKLWWLHSAYALGLGITVVAFAQKGFDHARWLAVSIGAAWLLVVLFFRLFGSGREQAHLQTAGAKVRLRFFAMTYALKNLYQGMLFFLLPFYWKSTTFWAPNSWFVVLLGICAFLSTLDIVFDRVVFRFRALASLFHGVALFGCLNLVVPALFPDTRTLYSLLVAMGITVLGFWTIHVSLAMLRDRRWILLFFLSATAALGGAYAGRTAIPPVPMYVSRGAVGPMVLPDGRLAMVVHELHPSVIDKLIAITDVVVPGGKGDRLVHVWRHDGDEIHRATETTSRVDGPEGTVRLRSALSGRELPKRLIGSWAIDVETQDGQLVGRVSFVVAD